MFSREELERSIVGRLPDCSHDELRVIAQVLIGIELGRASYGPLNLQRDPRRFKAEASMELRDWLFYAACVDVAEQARSEEQARREREVFDRVADGLRELRKLVPISPREDIDVRDDIDER